MAAALNLPMGSFPLRVGRCFCGVTAKVATGDPHPLTPTGRCTPVPSTKELHPSALLPEKADCPKHSQSAFPAFEESSSVTFFKKKNRCISLLRKIHRFFARIFIAWFYCCIIPAGSGNLAAMHRGTETFSLSLRTLQRSNRPGFLLQSPCQMLYAEVDCQP